jgi:hypothetical protein
VVTHSPYHVTSRASHNREGGGGSLLNVLLNRATSGKVLGAGEEIRV